MEKSKTMDEELLEAERWIDDDYEMISQFYTAKRMYPDIPFICRMKMETIMYLVGI